VRIAYVDFWPRFRPEHFPARFPALAAVTDLRHVEDPREAELVVFSCFPNGRRTTRPRDPRDHAGARGTRLFYTAENVRPDFATCDYAISFARDLVDDRHLRVPNYVCTQAAYGFAPEALRRRVADPAEARRAKTRFCTYVQGNPVPFREDFVRALSRYARVDCAGPSLNNTGFVADRARKYELYRESKFAVTFENEAAVGYTSEKMPDALLSGCVPIYWGDPTVHLDFDPRCFVHARDYPTFDALIERVAELDRDDAAYEAMLGAARLRTDRAPDGADPDVLHAFFERVVASAALRAAGTDRAALARRS